MNKYIIYCTEEQTKKAIELGAPIERGHEGSRYFNVGVPTFYDENDEICRVKNSVIFIPTAEQMMGWLEEQDIFICSLKTHYSNFISWLIIKNVSGRNLGYFNTHKEAIFASIDEALVYLSESKKSIEESK